MSTRKGPVALGLVVGLALLVAGCDTAGALRASTQAPAPGATATAAPAAPPAAGESAALRAALDDTAHFRAMLALVAAGDEDAAHEQLAALQERDPKGP